MAKPTRYWLPGRPCSPRLTPLIPNDSSGSHRDRWRCRVKSGSTLRPMGRNPACYNYRATLISSRSCLKPVDTLRGVVQQELGADAAPSGSEETECLGFV